MKEFVPHKDLPDPVCFCSFDSWSTLICSCCCKSRVSISHAAVYKNIYIVWDYYILKWHKCCLFLVLKAWSVLHILNYFLKFHCANIVAVSTSNHMAKSNVILDFLFRSSVCGEILWYRSLSPIIILSIHSWKTNKRTGFGKTWLFSLRFMFVFDKVIPKNTAIKKLKTECLFCESAGLTAVAASLAPDVSQTLVPFLIQFLNWDTRASDIEYSVQGGPPALRLNYYLIILMRVKKKWQQGERWWHKEGIHLKR